MKMWPLGDENARGSARITGLMAAPDRAVAPRLIAAQRTSPVVRVPTGVFERTSWQRRYAARLRITDTVVVCAAVILAHYLRFGSELAPTGYPRGFVPTFSVLFAVGWLYALASSRSRSPRVVGSGFDEYRRVISASFWTFGAIAIVTLLLRIDIARGYLAVALPVGTAGLIITRYAWRKHISSRRREGHYQTAVMAFGDLTAVREVAGEMTRNSGEGFHVVGVGIAGYGEPRGEYLALEGRNIPIIGGEAQLVDATHEYGADTVVITSADSFGVRGVQRLAWELEPMGVDLILATGVADVALSRLVMRPIAGLPLLHVEKPQYHGTKRFQKRAFDTCFAMAVLLVASPILAIAALAVKVYDRGPVLYCSERIGIGGEPFSMLKFRTMVADADKQLPSLLANNESDGVLFKIRDDPRVTPVGRVLRRLSIDELPQFINVLRNEMSVVGPRPPLRREADRYDRDVLRRLLVKPGITGLWQVSGRSDLIWSDAVRLDLSYVDNWSMVGDLLIVLKTVGAVLERKGAY
jgi:exopolysaccharide biosynthesis polyprenyl glycosylphosphotransferase